MMLTSGHKTWLRYQRVPLKSGLVLSLLLVSVLFASGFFEKLYAQDEEVQEYLFPEIGPDINLKLGYSLIHFNGPVRVEEYEYLKNSPYLGGEIVYFYFPHRLNIDVELKNRKDYYGDLSYSFKDLFFFRTISRSIFHNLENIAPSSFDLLTGLPSTDIRDTGEVYGIRSGVHSLFLRLKYPDYPLHVYVDGRIIDKEGYRQQPGLLGSGYFNNIIVGTRKREIDWRLNEVIIGTNSHLGPVEIDLSHGESRFNVRGDNVLYDRFTSAGFYPYILRDEGVFPHNLIPEIKGSSNTIKIHSSYTGGIVASASLSKLERENKDSGAKVKYLIGAGEVMWMPLTKLSFFIKYRHRERDIENPDVYSVTDISDPRHSHTYLVKEAISSTTETITGIVRYRPIKGLTLSAEYNYEDMRRDFADLWELPSSTRKGTLTVAADIRLHRTVSIKARYIHRDIDNPSYSYEPNNADEGKISLTWTPHYRINAFLGYAISEEKRDDIYFRNTNSKVERGVKKDRVTGNITFLIFDNLSLTTGYSYIHNRTMQDITMETLTHPYNHLKDSMVPYKDLAKNYSIDINFEPAKRITFSSGVNYTISRAIFYPSINEFSEIPEMSQLKARETIYSFNGEYRFRDGLSFCLRYRYTSLNDVIDNPYDDVSDGNAHIILLTLTKKWK